MGGVRLKALFLLEQKFITQEGGKILSKTLGLRVAHL